MESINLETPPSVVEFPSLMDKEAWEDPVLFDDIETPDIPASLLPGVLGEFAQALANATETPQALSAMVVLGVLSVSVAKCFKVSPKEGWKEPINIYTLIALPPANNKTLVLNSCTQPLIEWEKEQAAMLEYEIKRQSAEYKNQQKSIEVLRAKAAKEADSLAQKQLFEEIIDKELMLVEPKSLPLLFANDATPESLAMSTYEQGGRFAIFSDEGGILETLAGLYSQGSANIDILLKGIDGGEMRVRRKDRSFHLNPYLTIVLAIQPAVMQGLGEKRAYLGNGALERFLYVLPKSNLGFRTHDKQAIPAHIQQQYLSKIKSLLNRYLGAGKKEDEAIILTLNSEAYQAWREFQAMIEVELRSQGRLAICQGWGGKICGFALRIAGLLHIAEHERADSNLVISYNSMSRALKIATLLIEHAIAAFGLMGADQAIQDAKEVFQWFTSNGKSSFTRTEVTNAMRHRKCGKSDRLTHALKLLKDRNLISLPMMLPTRKPTTMYYVHPAVVSSENKS